MSSKKTNVHLRRRGKRVVFIVPWKVLGAPVKPNAITVNLN